MAGPGEQITSREAAASDQRVSAAQFLLLLHSLPGLGEKALGELLARIAKARIEPTEFLRLGRNVLQSEFELDGRTVSSLAENISSLLASARESARLLADYNVQVLSSAGARYPRVLETFDAAPPAILYCRGWMDLLDCGEESGRFRFTVAVSNGAGAAALNAQDEIAADLISVGGVPVTGHDRVAYQRLALCAQRVGRPALYVMDRGLRDALGPEFNRPPFAAARIRTAQFDTTQDLAISPFKLDAHCLGGSNRRRDDLI
ncbi:MAG TPA: hypothetical protein VGS41_17750, partial [Chthonomonadales bacterium]|nr:hypothetical protein [Chthonomonadales bacterium]